LKSRFVIGIIGSHYALNGFVKVKPLSGEMGHFFRLKTVTLRKDGAEKDHTVAEIAPYGNLLIMRFDGVNSPEAARLLNGAEIIVDREYAAPLNEGEFYVEDLKGIAVLTTEGLSAGRIHDVIEGGGGQLVEITLASGEKRLAPFRNEFFGEVNLKDGTIILKEPWVLE